MKDPTRLRDAKSPHARAARDLLRNAGGAPSGSGFTLRGLAGPSLDQSDAIWASLAAAIGPMPPGGGGGGGGSGSSGGGNGHGHGGTGGTSGPDALGDPTGGGLAAGGGAGSGVAASGASAAHVASATSGAIKVAATTAAAPAGKAALSLTAAKVWIALGIGAAGSVGTAAYVASPSPARESAAIVAIADDGARPTAAPGLHREPAAKAVESTALEPIAEPSPEAPVAIDGPLAASPAAPAPSAPAPVVGAAPAPAAALPQPGADAKKAEPAAPEAATPALSPTLSPAERASRLRDEAKATADARVALRSGDAAGALRLLADAARSFGGGGMGQEREALTIEALARSGAREAAGARAQAFLARWPASAYAAAVRPFAIDSIPK